MLASGGRIGTSARDVRFCNGNKVCVASSADDNNNSVDSCLYKVKWLCCRTGKSATINKEGYHLDVLILSL